LADRLVDILKRFQLQARVFQSGRVCETADFVDPEGMGYLHILQRGQIEVTSESHDPLTLNAPAMFFYMHSTEHQILPRSDDVNMVCASFQLGAGVINPLVLSLPSVVTMDLQEHNDLEDLLNLLFAEAFDNHCGRQAILDRLMEVVWIRALRALMDQGQLSTGLLAGLADDKLAKAINAIHKNPERPWSLEELASMAIMSRARFAARFHEVVGVTPGAYLSHWRLSIAQTLLKEGKPTPIIADTVGYGSASAFARAFKAQFGMSPTQWLQQ
jgi:AraC-like DNA-binding protein